MVKSKRMFLTLGELRTLTEALRHYSQSDKFLAHSPLDEDGFIELLNRVGDCISEFENDSYKPFDNYESLCSCK